MGTPDQLVQGFLCPACATEEEFRQAEDALGKLSESFNSSVRATPVPRVFRQRGRVRDQGRAASRPWDEKSFFEELTRRRGSEEAAVAQAILGWARDQALLIRWGHGAQYGTLLPSFEGSDDSYSPFTIWTNGPIQLNLAEIEKAPAFAEEAAWRELLARLTAISGVAFPDDAVDKYPSIRLGQLKDPAALERFLAAFDWAIEQMRSA